MARGKRGWRRNQNTTVILSNAGARGNTARTTRDEPPPPPPLPIPSVPSNTTVVPITTAVPIIIEQNSSRPVQIVHPSVIPPPQQQPQNNPEPAAPPNRPRRRRRGEIPPRFQKKPAGDDNCSMNQENDAFTDKLLETKTNKDEKKFFVGRVTLDEVWKILKDGIDRIYRGEVLDQCTFMELFTIVHNYCSGIPVIRRVTPDFELEETSEFMIGEKLYNRLQMTINGYVRRLLKASETTATASILKFYLDAWRAFKESTKALNNVFSYLNKYWVIKEQEEGRYEVRNVSTLSYVSWLNELLKPGHMKVLDGAMTLINMERNGEVVDLALLGWVVDSFLELGSLAEPSADKDLCIIPYKRYFETPFLSSTVYFLFDGSNAFLKDNSIVAYLKKVEQILSNENRLVNSYLHESTLTPVMDRCYEVLIADRLDEITAVLPNLMLTKSVDDLTRLYRIISNGEVGVKQFQESLTSFLHKQGLGIIEENVDDIEKNATSYVELISSFHKENKDFLQLAFPIESGCLSSLDKACQKLININAITDKYGRSAASAEFVAKFCDAVLKRGSKYQDDKQITVALDKAMTVFVFLESKDVFLHFYANALAKRLVLHNSISDDMEMMMVSLLQGDCGFDYGSKLKKMFQDMIVSKDLCEEYKTYSDECNLSLDIDFSIQVLASNVWPFREANPFSLPFVIERSISLFNGFYLGKHQGRKLIYLYQMSRGDLVGNCFDTRYVFQASTYQMVVLLEFNNGVECSLGQLLEATQLTKEVLNTVVESLIRVQLLKANASKIDEFDNNTQLVLQTDYTHKKHRVIINSTAKTEIQKERQEVVRNAEIERDAVIDAAVVRIMKAKRVLTLQVLVTLVLAELAEKFKPDVSDITKSIIRLTAREFLEKTSTDTYVYMA